MVKDDKKLLTQAGAHVCRKVAARPVGVASIPTRWPCQPVHVGCMLVRLVLAIRLTVACPATLASPFLSGVFSLFWGHIFLTKTARTKKRKQAEND